MHKEVYDLDYMLEWSRTHANPNNTTLKVKMDNLIIQLRKKILERREDLRGRDNQLRYHNACVEVNTLETRFKAYLMSHQEYERLVNTSPTKLVKELFCKRKLY